jgi:hypothetical protein
MTPDEMELAKSILSGLKNATGYGYDVLISGTVLKNELDLIATGIWIAVSCAVIWHVNKRIDLSKRDAGDKMMFWCGVACCLIVIAFLISIIEGSIFGMIAPQYVAMDRIIGLMAAKT